MSGDFANVGGQARARIAALDTVRGEATAWNPGANGDVSAFVVAGTTIYAGGYFTRIGGQRRRYIAALDASTGLATPWNPDAEFHVYTMVLSGNTMYAGGFFDSMGGVPRKSIAAVDATTGAVTPWSPNPGSGWVNAIVVSGNTVYVGGVLHQIGGQAREALAALDASTGAATAWDPHMVAWDSFYPEVYALAASDSTLYVGGEFAGIGGQQRLCLAEVDMTTGATGPWDPGTDGYVWTLEAGGSTIYAGGWFTRMGGLPCAGLAAISDSVPTGPDSHPLRLISFLPIAPNPTDGDALVQFSLSAAAPVKLAVYEVMGRRVSTVLNRAPRPAGPQEVVVRTAGWPPGVYYCRLEAGGETATRKMLVVR